MTTLPYQPSGMGVPAFEVVDTYNGKFLLAGNHPELAEPVALAQKASTTLAQFTVVGYDGSGLIVPAVHGGGTPIQAIGVVAQESTVDSGGGAVLVFYQGCFNIDALVWDASFTTDAMKIAAFNGAPTPTQIIAAKR